MPIAPAEQEFVTHLFAPLGDEQAYRQLTELWRRCGDELAMTEPIPGTRLPAALPERMPGPGTDEPLAGCQDATADFQAVLRRDHDVLCMSLAFADPAAAPPRRARVGTAAPSGWYEFTRWWTQLTSAGTGELLGTVQILLGKLPGPDREDWGDVVHDAVPAHDGDAAGWWRRVLSADGNLTVWETGAGAAARDRRLVVMAEPDQDVEQSVYTWSDGEAEAALPPLGRYLMHASKLRHHARLLRESEQLIAGIRERCDAAAYEVDSDLGAAARNGSLAELRNAEAEVSGVLGRLETMQTATGMAIRNMRAAIGALLPADDAVQDWLTAQIAADIGLLDAARRHAERLRDLAQDHKPVTPEPVRFTEPAVSNGQLGESNGQLGDRYEHRMALGIDIVGYSKRTDPLKTDAQRRVNVLIGQVLDDMGMAIRDTDRQHSGDGMNVVLPATLEMHVALGRLLTGWRDRLRHDNEIHRDRLRVRLSVTAGQIKRTEIGFGGNMIVVVARLLNAKLLRDEMIERDDLDVAALISDRLHEDVVVPDHFGLSPAEFERCEIVDDKYSGTAWLWPGRRQPRLR